MSALPTKTILALCLVTAAVSAQSLVPVAGFECQAPGAFIPTGPPDCEGWTSLGGTQVVLPVGPAPLVPCGVAITGTQWAEVSPNLVGPAAVAGCTPVPGSPCVPPGGVAAGAWPFVAGTVSEMQRMVTVPVVNGDVLFEVDWYFFSGEQGASPFNDFAQIVLVNPSNNTVVSRVMYVDTFSLPPSGNACTSAVSGIAYATTFQGPQTASVVVPSQFQGQQLLLSIVAANQEDNAFDSVLHVDGIRWNLPVDPLPPFSTAAASPATGLAANGVASSTITVTLRDSLNNPIPGLLVTLDATGAGNLITQPAAMTDLNGVATGSIASTVSGVKVVSAVVDGLLIAQQPTVQFGSATLQIERVSVSTSGVQGNGKSKRADISSDGRFAAFQSEATNLLAGSTVQQPAPSKRTASGDQVTAGGAFTDSNLNRAIFVRDRVLGTTEKVSVDSNGVAANDASEDPTISGDGRFVAFCSEADNLVPGDTNDEEDIFVHDRLGGTTMRVSVGPAGAQGNEDSSQARISTDGNVVAFRSEASNLVPGDGNNQDDIFVHDLTTGVTEIVSVSSAGVQANKSCNRPSISSDGRFVAFQSLSSNLVPGDTNGKIDVFVRDRLLGTTMRASVTPAGLQGNFTSNEPSIADDGSSVAFESKSTTFVTGVTSAEEHIFLTDLTTGGIELISQSTGGAQGDDESEEPSVSADGRYVAFWSVAGNLVGADTNLVADVFVRDRVLGTTIRVSLDAAGLQGNKASTVPSITPDGLLVTFTSAASNLVTGDTNGVTDVFVAPNQ